MANNTITVSIKCSICGKKHNIEITKEQYEDMRIQVSRYLKKLIADLPDPEPEDDEE